MQRGSKEASWLWGEVSEWRVIELEVWNEGDTFTWTGKLATFGLACHKSPTTDSIKTATAAAMTTVLSISFHPTTQLSDTYPPLGHRRHTYTLTPLPQHIWAELVSLVSGGLKSCVCVCAVPSLSPPAHLPQTKWSFHFLLGRWALRWQPQLDSAALLPCEVHNSSS